MVVRNVVRSPVRAVVQSVFGEGESFHPFQLFRSGAQGAWYDPSDFSTLYQDAAGTTPVTAVEQPVRLMLDRSRGLVLGSELWTAFGTITVPWTSVGGGVFSIDGSQAGNRDLSQSSQYVSGKFYVTTFTLSGVTGGTITVFAGEGNGVAYGNGAHTIRSSASQAYLIFRAPAGVAATVSAVSVRELPGNHAVAPNDASRPVLRARYNLLTFSEQFDNADWTKSSVTVTANSDTAPDGTLTADTLEATGANGTALGSLVLIAGSYTFSVYLRRKTGTGNVDISAHSGGTWVTQTLTSSWARYTVTQTLTAGTRTPGIRIVTSGDEVYAWGAQLLSAADQAATGGAYQRVGAATDYDTGPPWRPYLAFDGSDDSMSTSSIDFSGTDEMTVFAGVTKLSDAVVAAIIAELSSGATNNKYTLGGYLAGTPDYYFHQSGGTSLANATVTSSVYAAPVTNVLTGSGDISAPVSRLRINGSVIDTNTATQGTGNYPNAPLFIGRRNNVQFPFNGRLYGLTVLGRTATAPELSAMEAWVAGKTGVSL